jgi:hypothetical protein
MGKGMRVCVGSEGWERRIAAGADVLPRREERGGRGGGQHLIDATRGNVVKPEPTYCPQFGWPTCTQQSQGQGLGQGTARQSQSREVRVCVGGGGRTKSPRPNTAHRRDTSAGTTIIRLPDRWSFVLPHPQRGVEQGRLSGVFALKLLHEPGDAAAAHTTQHRGEIAADHAVSTASSCCTHPHSSEAAPRWGKGQSMMEGWSGGCLMGGV